jgi:hypothetical protein
VAARIPSSHLFLSLSRYQSRWKNQISRIHSELSQWLTGSNPED